MSGHAAFVNGQGCDCLKQEGMSGLRLCVGPRAALSRACGALQPNPFLEPRKRALPSVSITHSIAGSPSPHTPMGDRRARRSLLGLAWHRPQEGRSEGQEGPQQATHSVPEARADRAGTSPRRHNDLRHAVNAALEPEFLSCMPTQPVRGYLPKSPPRAVIGSV